MQTGYLLRRRKRQMKYWGLLMRKDDLENMTLTGMKPNTSLINLCEWITLQETGLEKGQVLLRATSNRRLS